MARQRKPQHRDQTVPGAKGVKPSRAHNTQSPNQAQGVTARRLAMLANGYAPLPAHKKAVYLTDWVNVVPTEEMIQGWEQQYPDWRNSGIATRKTPAIDIDIKDEPVAEQLEELVRKRFSNGGRLLRRIGMPPKRAFLFKTTAPFAKLKEEFIAPDGSKHKIEILCDGQQVIADGIHPDTKRPYDWHGGEPWTVNSAELVTLTADKARAWLDEAIGLLVGMGWRHVGQSRTTDTGKRVANDDAEAPDPALVAAAVAAIPPTTDRDQRVKVGHAIKASDADGFDIWYAWLNRSEAPPTRTRAYKRWCGFKPERIGFGTLHYLATEADPTWEHRHYAALQAKLAEAARRHKAKRAAARGEAQQDEAKAGDAKSPTPDTDDDAAGLPLIVRLGLKLCGGKWTNEGGGQFRVGPLHIDTRGRTWFDFQSNTGGGINDLMRLVTEVGGQGETAPPFAAEPYNFPAEETLPRWDFLYGKHLLRKTVSGTAAFGGTGKSTLAIAEALAMTTGRAILGHWIPRPLRVLLINLEDNREAMDKRLAAAMKHYDDLKPADTGGRLFTKAKGELKFKIAKRSRTGNVEISEAIIKELIDFIVTNKIDVLSIDPLIKTHSVRENESTEMEAVISCYDDIAEKANCAVSLWHHTRKSGGGEITIESARGAIAFVDACRAVRILETMTKTEAESLKLEKDKAGFYFSEFSGKLSFAPPADQRFWYRLVSVELNNKLDIFVDGDNVGVATSWAHPGTKQIDLSPSIIEQIKAVIRSSEWREDVRATMWVGKAVAQAMGLDHEQDAAVIKRIIKTLLQRGVLKIVPGKKANREPTTLVVVADEPVAPEADAPVAEPGQPAGGQNGGETPV